MISALRSGSSFNCFQQPEELAVGTRRAAFLLLAARVANQGAQRLEIGAGMARDVVGERAIVADQALAQRLEAAVARGGFGRLAGERVELRADRCRIDVAHQPADVLQLAALAFVAADALRVAYRGGQHFGQLELVEVRVGELDERCAERLQRVHLFLAPCLADRLVVHRGYDSAPMPKRHGFTFTPPALREMAEQVLARAKRAGASGCDCEVSEAYGLTVTVRRGKPDTIEHNRDRSLGVTVYFGERPKVRRGHASTSDLSPAALEQTVDAAAAIARHTAQDDCAGLPEPDLLAKKPRDLDLFHPWELSTEEAIAMAKRCEEAAFATAPVIRNSEGATVSTQQSQFVLANSLGFVAGYPGSRHYLSCAVIAEAKGLMQRDDWYSSSRVPAKIADPRALGRYAAQRAASRLNGRKIATCQAPVLFEAPVAIGLVGHFVSAVNGGNLYRKTSFLLDSLGEQVFAPAVDIEERPFEPQGAASTSFDDEGVATRERFVVRGGVLEGYFLGSYAARKLGMQTTGNAGGHHNLVLKSNGPDFAGMLRKMGRGLLVTELLGHGINLVTGDYSRGAAGYWVDGGEIQFPVEEITIAGNLRDMFKGIVAVGSDVLVRSGRESGSILIDNMTIAGE